MSQWADDSMTPSPIKVTKDKYGNECAENGRYSHENCTPAEGDYNWGGNQYDDSPGKGGFGSYGKSVSGENSVERTTVNVAKAGMGKES